MTPEEKQEALLNCNMPVISLDTVTFNYYAAVANNLGKNIVLDAVADIDNSIAMAYHYKGGLQFATQFHIEELHSEDSRQNGILNSFLELVKSHHHEHGKHSPKVVYPLIEKRLTECQTQPTCDKPQTWYSEASYQDLLIEQKVSYNLL